MREAPDAGYRPALKADVGTFFDGLYVYRGAEDRYGKLWGIRYMDSSFAGETFRGLSLSYLVQAFPVGTRSMNPEGLSDFGR